MVHLVAQPETYALQSFVWSMCAHNKFNKHSIFYNQLNVGAGLRVSPISFMEELPL